MRNPNESIGFLMHDVSRLMRRSFARRAGDIGLTQAQCKALAYAARHPGLKQAQLADLMDIQPITAARLIDHLQSVGLVERRPDPRDRRAQRIYTTPDAGPLLERIWELAAESRREALAGLPDEMRDQVIDALHHMRRNLIAAGDEGEATSSPVPADEE